MSLINYASDKIARSLGTLLNFDSDKQEVIAYGAFSLLQTLASTILLILFGLITKTTAGTLLIALSAAILRKSSGGAHATSPNRCAITSVMIFGGLSLLTQNYMLNINEKQLIFLQLIILAFSLLIITMFAPADSPNKRITAYETRLRLKRKSYLTIISYEILAAIMWVLFLKMDNSFVFTYILYIHIGVLWQSLSITTIGHFFVKSIDTLLMKIHI